MSDDDDKLPVSRRGFLQLTALGAAGASLASCDEVIPVPRHRLLRGAEQNVTTVCGACPSGCGITVRVVGGNAVRIQGLAEHVVNDGGICPSGAAEIQNLYHPDRVRHPTERREGRDYRVSWEEGLAQAARRLRGESVVIGIGRLSPVEHALVERIASALSATIVPVGLPLDEPPADAMSRMLGSDSFTYDLSHADCVLSLGADWLQASLSPVEAQRAFAAVRRRSDRGRIFTASPRLSVTASHADRWIPVQTRHLALYALGVAHTLLSEHADALAPHLEELAASHADFAAYRDFVTAERFAAATVAHTLGVRSVEIQDVAAALVTRPNAVVVTDRSMLDVQLAGMGLNLLIGAVGRAGGVLRRANPEFATPPPSRAPARRADFPQTAANPVVLLYRANPLFLAAAGSGWRSGLARASWVCSVSPFSDESGAAANLLLPLSTPLESRQLVWGSTSDAQPFVSAGPPAVTTLYHTREGADVLLRLGDLLRLDLGWRSLDAYLAETAEAAEATDLLQQGGFKVYDPAEPAEAAPARSFAAAQLASLVTATEPAADRALPLTLHTSSRLAFLGGLGAHLPYLHGLSGADGRELWATSVEINPHPAAALGIQAGDRVWVESAHKRIAAIAVIREGIRPDTVAVAIGLGRTELGQFATGYGASPIPLVATGPDGVVRWNDTPVRVRRVG